nr:MAG TPA: hypothetical protein [Caudoviricetes sp.]
MGRVLIYFTFIWEGHNPSLLLILSTIAYGFRQ